MQYNWEYLEEPFSDKLHGQLLSEGDITKQLLNILLAVKGAGV